LKINRPLASRSSFLYRGVSSLAVLVGIACSADHIVSIGTGVETHRVTTGIGGLVDVGLWDGAMGGYASPPAISGSAVTFVDVTSDGPPNPGGPTQHFRFRAIARGSAIVTFTPLSVAPVVVDTIDVD
jgi:hypothetical protein